MPVSCCAIGCTNRFVKGSGIGFYTFPPLGERRNKWIAVMRRRNWQPKEHDRLCGKHFIQGRPCHDPDHPDWVPSLFPYRKGSCSAEPKVQRYERANKRRLRALQEIHRTISISKHPSHVTLNPGAAPSTSHDLVPADHASVAPFCVRNNDVEQVSCIVELRPAYQGPEKSHFTNIYGRHYDKPTTETRMVASDPICIKTEPYNIICSAQSEDPENKHEQTIGDSTDAEMVEGTSDGSALPQRISRPSVQGDILVLDDLRLEPLVPYQTVSQYGFVYTLVPYKNAVVEKRQMEHKRTQTAAPTSTLGTQTRFLMPSSASQTGLSLPPSSTLMLTSLELSSAMKRTNGKNTGVGTSTAGASQERTSVQLLDGSTSIAAFSSSLSGSSCPATATHQSQTSLLKCKRIKDK